MDAGEVDEPAVEAQAPRRVVVAARHHHPRPRRGQPVEGLVGQGHRVDRRQRPVVDVTGDHHEVDLLLLDGGDQVVDVRRLRGEEVLAVERPAEVPVGGVQQAHASNARSGRRQNPVAHAGHALGLWTTRSAPAYTTHRSGRVKPTSDQPRTLRERDAPERSVPRRRRSQRRRRRPPSGRARSRSGR